MQATLEERALKLSILVTLGVSSLGVTFGLLAGSQSILFDGVFSTIDAAMSGLALLVAFIIARFLQDTPWAHVTPYVDSVLLMVLTASFMPVPIGIVRRAMKEVLLIAPSEIDREVHAAMAPVMTREGLLRYYSHVAKAGRGHYIEIHIVTTPEYGQGQGIAVLDEIREQISAKLSPPPERRWFTVAFTADERWA